MTDNTTDNSKKELICSFCGKNQHEVKKLIAGPAVFICDECISLCGDIIKKGNKKSGFKKDGDNPKPEEIIKILNDFVIGQAYAKKVLSVAVYNHYKRIDVAGEDDVELSKSNILLIGPTGCGKTLLAQTLARILDVPFAMADATSLTEAGYVGDDVENVISRLLQAADYNVEKTQKGIIYIDEIDKITRKSENPSITRDISGEGVQQGLLKIIEGTVASVPPQGGRRHPQQEYIQIDTKNILFICAGAFSGLERIVTSRKDKGASIGFGAEMVDKDLESKRDDIFQDVQPEDIVKYGIIPELVGRLPVVASLNNLSQEDLIRILTEPKNSIVKQYQKLFKIDQVDLEFDKSSLKEIAKKAIERKTGARGLRAIVENALLDIMFEIPSKNNIKKITVNDKTITEGKKPKVTLLKDQEKKPIKAVAS